MRAKTFGRLMVAPAVIILLVVGVVPFFYSLYLALFRSPPNPAMPATYYGMGNFWDLLKDKQFADAALNTGILLAVTVPAKLVLGFMLALALRQVHRLRGVAISLVLIPSALAPIVVGIGWWMMFSPRFGPVNAILEQWFGIAGRDWPIQMPEAFISIIIATIWQSTPFVAVILLGGLLAIPDSLTEAAQIDGASGWSMLWHIILPLMRPYFLIAGLLQIIGITQLYEIPWFITQGGPGNETVMAGIYLYKLAFNFVDLGRASMMAFFLVIALIIMSTVYIKWLSHRDEADARQFV